LYDLLEQHGLHTHGLLRDAFRLAECVRTFWRVGVRASVYRSAASTDSTRPSLQ